MADKRKTYDVDEFNKQKRQGGKGVEVPPQANILAAANHIRDLFENKKFVYGFMGGLEMLCLGYRREQPDLHIAYDDKDFDRIKAKLEADKRVQLPDGMNPLFPSKILVQTGPGYKDTGCPHAATIEVDLIPPSSHGTPPSGMLSNNLVSLNLKEAKVATYKGLGMLYLVKTLIHYCTVRDLVWDPRKDILFLCKHYAKDVQAIRAQLDRKAVQQNFLGTQLFSKLSFEDQRRCYQILLGTEPPPIMSVTPPVSQPSHRHTQSASVTPRPRITSHHSSPSLSTNPAPTLRGPLLFNNSKSSQQSTVNSAAQPTGINASPSPPSNLPASGRDSRSRYRVVSAPHSRKHTPDDPEPAHNLRPHSTERRCSSQQVEDMSHNTQSISVQNVADKKALATANLAPIPRVAQARQSMPSLPTGFTGSPSSKAIGQSPFMNGSMPLRPQQQLYYTAPMTLSAAPAALNPGQQYLKSKLGLAGDFVPGDAAAWNTPITHNPTPPHARDACRGPQQAEIRPHETAASERQSGSRHVVSPDEEAAPLQPYHPKPELLASKLQLVDSKEPGQPPQEQQELTRSAQGKAATAPTPRPFAFELEAVNSMVAELSADIDTALQIDGDVPTQAREPLSEAIQRRDQYQSTLEDAQGLHTTPETNYSQRQESDRPSRLRTKSAPLTTLPPSLTVGGADADHSRHRSTSNASSITPPQTMPTQRPVSNSNVPRYTRYYATPSTAPNSTHTSPQLTPAPLAIYKAYQPSHTPLSPPSSEFPEQQPRVASLDAVQNSNSAQTQSHTHKREASNDSYASNSSDQLAHEYQAELPSFERGFASRADIAGEHRRNESWASLHFT